MTAAIPEQASFSEASSGRDYRLIANGLSTHAIEGDEIAGRKGAHSPRAGFEVIDEQGGGQVNLFGEPGLFDDPGQVGSFDAPVAHRTRDSEAGNIGTGSRTFEKLFDNFAELVMLAAGEDALGN